MDMIKRAVAQNNTFGFGSDGLKTRYVDLKGTCGAATVSDSPGITTQWTVEFWIKLNSQPTTWDNNRILMMVGGSPTHGFYISININTYQLNFQTIKNTSEQSSCFLESPYLLSTTVWRHIACIFNDGTGKICFDGILRKSATSMKYTNPNPSCSLRIGRYGTSDFLDAKIDDFRIWNVARSESEIANNKDVELTGRESGLIAYWPMNEYNWNHLMDKSPNNRNAKLDNSTFERVIN